MPGLGGVRVERITGQKHTIRARELVSEALADTVATPPERLGELHFIGRKNLLGFVVQVRQCDVFDVRAAREFYVEADKRAAFAGDDEYRARGGVDSGFAADVGKVCPWVDVHDAPDGVGGVADHVVAKGFADD